MTDQQAIKTLEHTKRNCGLPEQGDTWKPNAETIAIDTAIKALEKQIPKKHVYENGNYNCPICSHPALSVCARRKNYCDNCGQKLDWSET